MEKVESDDFDRGLIGGCFDQFGAGDLLESDIDLVVRDHLEESGVVEVVLIGGQKVAGHHVGQGGSLLVLVDVTDVVEGHDEILREIDVGGVAGVRLGCWGREKGVEVLEEKPPGAKGHQDGHGPDREIEILGRGFIRRYYLVYFHYLSPLSFA